jgi:hypothetical protein
LRTLEWLRPWAGAKKQRVYRPFRAFLHGKQHLHCMNLSGRVHREMVCGRAARRGPAKSNIR